MATTLDELTPAQRGVLALLADGLPTKAIAARLGIAESTAKSHLAGVYARLGPGDGSPRVAATRWYWRQRQGKDEGTMGTGSGEELARLRAENAALRGIASDLQWQARRYVDGRLSYAVGLHNDHVRTLQRLGVGLNATGDGTVWARDGMRWRKGVTGGYTDGLTDAQVAEGRQRPDYPAWRDEEFAALREATAGDAAIAAAARRLVGLEVALPADASAIALAVIASGLREALGLRPGAGGYTGTGSPAGPGR